MAGYYVRESKLAEVKRRNAATRGDHLKPGDLTARVRCPCGALPTIHPTGLCKMCHGQAK